MTTPSSTMPIIHQTSISTLSVPASGEIINAFLLGVRRVMSRRLVKGIVERRGFGWMHLKVEEGGGRMRMGIVWGILALMMRKWMMKMMISRFRKFWRGGEGDENPNDRYVDRPYGHIHVFVYLCCETLSHTSFFDRQSGSWGGKSVALLSVFLPCLSSRER